ncbi:MAG: hypothetical protein E7302_00745 [Butyrivibrio sp.]|nr:hypothetical protein [Butyrivibrio sp.]
MKNKIRFSPAVKNIIFILLIVLCEIWTFRNIIFKGMLVGSDADGLLAVLMTEHWYKVLCGLEKWNNWISMFPINNTVALNDMYILHAIVYCPLRFLGVDKYAAFQITLIVLHFAGSILMYAFLHAGLKFERSSAFLGTACFSFGSYYIIKIMHSQFLALCLIPGIMASIYWFLKHINSDERSKRVFWMITGILCEVVLFYTSPYVAEFVLISVVICGFFSLVLGDKKLIFCSAISYVKSAWFEALGGILIGIILMIPFMKVYFPWASENTRSYKYASNFFVSPKDVFNVSTGNLIYGKWINSLGFVFGENTIGLTLSMWILAIVCLVVLIKRNERQYIALFISFALMFVIPMRFGDFCLWKAFYKFFPGASGMRVTCRIALMALPLIAVIAAHVFDVILKEKRKAIAPIIVTLLALWLVVENGYVIGVPSSWTYDAAISSENSFDVAPPKDCRSFFVVDSAGTPEQAEFPLYYQGFLQAWVLADKYNTPTLNGFGSYTPKKYGKVYNIYTSRYLDEVSAWIDANGLTDVYSYDVATKDWKRFN